MTVFKNETRVLYPPPFDFDITGYTITTYLLRPDATTVTKSGTITDATTGQTSITTVSTDLNQTGQFVWQSKAVSGGTTRWAPAGDFYVEATIV